MPPTKKEQMAFMAMMDNFLHSSLTCNCDDCRNPASSKKTSAKKMAGADKEHSHQLPKSAPSLAELSQHICLDHKITIPAPRVSSSAAKEKRKPPPSPTTSTSQTRNDKINSLLKAESVHAVLEVFKTTPMTEAERVLTQQIQNVAADGKSYPESKAKIIDLCNEDETDLDAVFGLLAKFRQERNLLTSAILKSNAEREKSLLLVHRVNQLMYELQNVAKDGKNSSGADVRGNLSEIIMEIHDLATKPSLLYDELLELRDEHFDLLQDHEDEHQKFLDVEACHEKLHEKNKKLMEDHNQLLKDFAESKKKASAANGLKNDVTRLEKLIDKGNSEKAELKKEIEKLVAEMAKVNALKHENTQLKKKVAATEVIKEEAKPEPKATESVQTNKKRKGKKASSTQTPLSEVQDAPLLNQIPDQETATRKQLKTLKSVHEEAIQELDVVKGNLRKFEALLKKAEVARDRAIEKQQVEQATSQNWKELSEGHSDECTRLKERLDQSVTQATMLQNSVHQLEQSLAECREQLQSRVQRRAISPSGESQASSASKIDGELIRLLRKIRTETRQLAQDLEESASYGGDPWNIISYTRKVVGEVEHDLDEAMGYRRENDPHNNSVSSQIPETFTPFSYNSASDLHISSPPNQYIGRPPPGFSPTNSASIPSGGGQLPTFRPMPPPGYMNGGAPGVSDTAFAGGRNFSSPLASVQSNTVLPAPVGTGRPGANRIVSSNNMKPTTPSPVPTPASSIARKTSTGSLGNSIGNGAAGVDWNMWAKPAR